MRTQFLAILSAAPAFAADLISASNCTGQPLYSGISLENTKCYDMSIHDGDTGESVLLSKLGSSEVVTFYVDSACQKPVEKFSSDTCFNSLGHLGSFQVANTDSTSKDLITTPIKLSNYRDLAVSSPYKIDLSYSNFFIYAAVVVCSAISGPDPVAITACIAVPLASIIAYVGHHFLAKAGRSAEGSSEMDSGTIDGRSPLEISELYARCTASLMARNGTDTEPYHIGFMSREADGIEHTSPIYELDTGTGGNWHLSAFLEPQSGTFIHYMHLAAETQLAKRSAPYDTILYAGRAVASISISAP
ncbi:hypothetical protein KCU71_g8993, partial [Aureobasidium melanogenum]